MPRLIGLSTYRLAINPRDSSVISITGNDGIGLQLNASINSLAWNQVSVIFVMIFATVLVSEWVSARVRHAII
ncbi:PhnE/PtxC family ABC transporter permease [Vreelandella alkaliphila]|uniref:PhnE/PtxC family ABC transporter permease n=1 Tax=Vreelandella alkaliphila TaxID=272774 RepID=UPI003F97836F